MENVGAPTKLDLYNEAVKLELDIRLLKKQGKELINLKKRLADSLDSILIMCDGGDRDVEVYVEENGNEITYYKCVDGESTGIPLFSVPTERQLEIIFPETDY